MAVSITVDGTPVTTAPESELKLAEAAEMGRVASGSIAIDDTAGTLAIVGHKAIHVAEDDCAVSTTFHGYVGDRGGGRGSTRVESSRAIQVTTIDLNARLGFKVLRGSTWRKRPNNDTVANRLTDLLADGALAGLVADLGFVDYPDTGLDGGDLRGTRPGDVLTDMATYAGFNFFVYWDDDEDEAGLWFKDSNASTDWTSDLRISNVLADIDTATAAGFETGTTFAPSLDAELLRSPVQTVSGLWMPFKRGNVYRTRPATEETYEARDGTAPSALVRRRSKARARADAFLRHHRNEQDTITTTLQLPASKVNLIRAGQRIEARFEHLATEGYGDFSWFRVTERSTGVLTDRRYPVRLTLSPQEAGGSCTTGIAQTSTLKVGSPPDPEGVRFDSAVTAGSLLVVYTVVHNEGTTPPFRPVADGWELLWTLWPFQGDKSPGRLWAKVATGSLEDGGIFNGLGYDVTGFEGFHGVVAAEITSTCGFSSATPTDTDGDAAYGGTTSGAPVVITKTVDMPAGGIAIQVTHIKSFGGMTLTEGGDSTQIGITQGAPADHPAIMVYRTGTGALTNTVLFDPAVISDWASVAVSFDPS